MSITRAVSVVCLIKLWSLAEAVIESDIHPCVSTSSQTNWYTVDNALLVINIRVLPSLILAVFFKCAQALKKIWIIIVVYVLDVRVLTRIIWLCRRNRW